LLKAQDRSFEVFNVFLDSDGPVADFGKALTKSGLDVFEFKHRSGTYLYLDVTPGAGQAISTLQSLEEAGHLKVWVLTKTPTDCPYAYTEKILWYRQNFPHLENRVILAHDKSLVGGPGDFLLDDRPHKGNAANFKGKFILFDERKPIQSWQRLFHEIDIRLKVPA
jgi:5'(3')-deoxyribonucleotidase